MANSDPRPRRWFQFSLRSLLIVVTLLAVPLGYVGWQARIVNERWTIRKELVGMIDNEQRRGYIDLATADETERAVPWIRTLIGDQAVHAILLPLSVSNEYRKRVRAIFPEADVFAFRQLSLQAIKPLPWPDEPQPANWLGEPPDSE